MHGSGKVERYDPVDGRHIETFVRGLTSPNALLSDGEGRLYISTGSAGGLGTVERYDAATGRKLGTFINVPAGQPGHLARATGMAWHEGDLLVASQGDGVVKRFDGKTGAWKADVAKASASGITQIAVHGGKLYLTDFTGQQIRVSTMGPDATLADTVTSADGHAPWGLAFAPNGDFFLSTSGERILRFDGKSTQVWAGAGGGLSTPVGLTLGPDGSLYAANLAGNNVTVWSATEANAGPPARVIGGDAMQSPIATMFSTGAALVDATVQVGNFVAKPSNTGKDWTPDGTTIYNLRASKAMPTITTFGIDTEGGDRAKLDLLKDPVRLVFTLDDGSQVDSVDLPATSQVGPNRIAYAFAPIPGADVAWDTHLDGDRLRMRFAVSGPQAARVAKAELLIPFDPRAMGTTVLAERWGAEGVVHAPLIISALDMGQLRLSNDGADEALACLFTGSRQYKKIDLRTSVLDATIRDRSIVFAPARLQKPNETISDADWAKVRRGLISLIQITPFVKRHEDGSPWLGSPGGITGNNVISDPVACNMDRNLQWLSGMGKQAVCMGIDLNKIARKTIEFWLNERSNADKSIDYVLDKGNISADSNTGVLNSATDYYLATHDLEFVRANRDVLLKAVNYFIDRDLDDDGLIETFRDGNGGNQFGDTGYDTISSGWKNAIVNGQAYKSYLGVAQMMADIGDAELADKYRQRATRLRQAYNKQFFDADHNRYIWWIGKDGKRHDYINPLIQENAVLFGIADCIEQDTGRPRGATDVMQSLWNALAAAEYQDSAKGKTVRYIDPKANNYTGFYWGIPGNLQDVPDAYNFSTYGTYEFPYYCNGGIFPQDTVAAIMAFRSAGMEDKAMIIQREIFRRQHQGILPNGSGFYMGVVNLAGQCYSILKWDGTPTDYEGIISRDCSFLQAILFTEDPAARLFNENRTRTFP